MLSILILAASAASPIAGTTDSRPLQAAIPLDVSQCERALADPMLRISVPSLLFLNTRREACRCIKETFASEGERSNSSPALANTVAKCVNDASSVARPEIIPSATLSSVSAAFRNQTSTTAIERRPLDLTSCKLPDYPRPATRAEATGVTRIAFLVDAKGTARSGVVARPSGTSEEHLLLDATALAHFKACKFAPAANSESPPTWIEVEYQWKLE
jgi:TonB family protein